MVRSYAARPDFVDRHVERLAHANVVHRRLHRVQHVVIDRALRLVHVIFRQAQTIDPCGRRNVVVQRVNLARLVQIHHRRRVFHWVERDRFEPHVLRIPILRIADVDELVVRLPGLQRERAARDDVLRLRPCLAVGLDGLARDGAEELMRDQPGKERHGLRERELDGAIVDRCHADVFRFAFALVVGLRAFDVVGEVCGSRGELRREAAAQRIHEVVRGDRIAVRPFRVAKIKGEFGVVAVGLPSLGERGNGLRCFRMVLGEPVVQARCATAPRAVRTTPADRAIPAPSPRCSACAGLRAAPSCRNTPSPPPWSCRRLRQRCTPRSPRISG